MSHQKPTETTYRDYIREVKTAAEVAAEALDEYPVDYDNDHRAVEYAVQGSQRIHDRGRMLVTVLLSDTDPDVPDYSEPWTERVDWINRDPTWTDVVSAMAYVCFFSDVMSRLHRMREEAEAEADL